MKKISELISELQEHKANHGDIQVCDCNGDWVGTAIQDRPEHLPQIKSEKVLVFY